jgi:hypothetical protein
VGRQIKVLGSYRGWKGHISNEGVNSLYTCTVHDYHVLTGGTLSRNGVAGDGRGWTD